MTTITCDICALEITADTRLRVELLDGEHPHNGSPCYKTVDCCVRCLSHIPNLTARVELSYLIKELRDHYSAVL